MSWRFLKMPRASLGLYQSQSSCPSHSVPGNIVLVLEYLLTDSSHKGFLQHELWKVQVPSLHTKLGSHDFFLARSSTLSKCWLVSEELQLLQGFCQVPESFPVVKIQPFWNFGCFGFEFSASACFYKSFDILKCSKVSSGFQMGTGTLSDLCVSRKK